MIQPQSLQRKLFKYYLKNRSLQKIKYFFKLAEILKKFKKLFRFNNKSILLLTNLMTKQPLEIISSSFSIFIGELEVVSIVAEILAVLGITKHYEIIHGILDIINVAHLIGDHFNFFSVLLELLVKDIPYELSITILVVIFNYYLAHNEKKNSSFHKEIHSTKTNEFLQIMGHINEKVNEIERILIALMSLNLDKRESLDKITKKSVFNLIVNKLRYLESDSSFQIFMDFLDEDRSFIYSNIIKSVFFPYSVVSLFKVSEVKAIDLVVYIFSRTLKLKNFEKLKILFDLLEDSSLCFKIYTNL